MSAKTSTVAVLAVAALGVAAVAFALWPKVDDWNTNRHSQEAGYATGAEAKSAHVWVPRWLPDGATSVHYRMSTTGGNRILRAQLPDGKLPSGCIAGARAGRAKLSASWFPSGPGMRATVSCGLYSGVLHGRDFYAWQDSAVWAATNQAERGVAR